MTLSASSFKPHPYQEAAIQWGLTHPKTGLLLPMGAGKTVITLSIISKLLGLDVARVLIIGPKRVIENTWPAEIKKWEHTKHMDYVVADAPMAKGKKPLPDMPITLVSKDNVTALIERCGSRFDMIVVDELSTFKSPSAKRFRALKRIRPERFIGLTGTPAPKGIPDLWAQIYLIDRGKHLGKTLTAFRERFLMPGMRSGYVVYSWNPKPGAQEEIEILLSEFCMSLTPDQCTSLPPVQYLPLELTMPAGLEKKYKAFAQNMVLDEEIGAANAGVLCGYLSQFTSGEIYEPDKSVKTLHSIKLEALKELIDEAQGSPVMVFYYYRHERDRLMRAIPQARLLSTSQDIEDWNAGKIPVLLVHPASAGHGLNLQAGGHIAVWYTLPAWNLELYEQANARIYRQGQKEPCVIYHLIMKNTIDERQLSALESKSATQKALIDALRKEIV